MMNYFENMKKIQKNEIKEIIQSGHLNFLIGSGCSQPYLPVLNDIENRMNDDTTRLEAQKEYYVIINKSKAVLNEKLETETQDLPKLHAAKNNYDIFINSLATVLSLRRLQIVNKQANIFTTNFDMFIEDSCERLNVPYNDGFVGQINRIFNVSNFNRVQKYKSLQFDNTSDVPLVNVIKMHGSLSWNSDEKQKKIFYSNGSHVSDDLISKSDGDFETGYKQISVINPNAEKHFETVLDTNYAAMLRKFTLELEKENSVLVIIGFSLADKHIRELLYGVMQTNPTLVVLFYSYSKYDPEADPLEEKSYKNLYVISPECDDAEHKQTFDKSSEDFFGMLTGVTVEENKL